MKFWDLFKHSWSYNREKTHINQIIHWPIGKHEPHLKLVLMKFWGLDPTDQTNRMWGRFRRVGLVADPLFRQTSPKRLNRGAANPIYWIIWLRLLVGMRSRILETWVVYKLRSLHKCNSKRPVPCNSQRLIFVATFPNINNLLCLKIKFNSIRAWLVFHWIRTRIGY